MKSAELAKEIAKEIRAAFVVVNPDGDPISESDIAEVITKVLADFAVTV